MHILAEGLTRPIRKEDASLVHAVYKNTPSYFDIISIPIPTQDEVVKEIEAAEADTQRFLELVLSEMSQENSLIDPMSGRHIVGYLDYKLDYPNDCDTTVNVVLIMEHLQRRGFAKLCIQDLEKRITQKTKRILASVYGQNKAARRFWEALGYDFAIDARPALEWYAKSL